MLWGKAALCSRTVLNYLGTASIAANLGLYPIGIVRASFGTARLEGPHQMPVAEPKNHFYG